MNICRKFIVVIGCLGVISGTIGCANKAIVKKDEPLVANKVAAAPSSAAVPTGDSQASTELKKDEAQQPAAVNAVDNTQQPTNTAAVAAAFETVYFDFDSTDLSSDARNTLARNAEILMKTQQDVKLRIEGHSDERGSAEYNLALGERRAKAAAKYLVTMGVQPDRLSLISYGEERPAVQGYDESAWSKNRRDEFVIQK
ncbi:MAG: peptidoglycan-associated lipoprotein Pal [Desulfuromonadaceae bacterium]